MTNSDVVRYQQCLGSGLSGLLTIWGSLGIIFERQSFSETVFFLLPISQNGFHHDISAKMNMHN